MIVVKNVPLSHKPVEFFQIKIQAQIIIIFYFVLASYNGGIKRNKYIKILHGSELEQVWTIFPKT